MHEYSILFIRTEEHPGTAIEAAVGDALEGEIEWTRAEALFDGLRVLQERAFDLIISDLFLPDGQGLATVRHLNQHAPATPVIVLCHVNDRDTAVTAVRKGAHDFFCYEDLDSGNLRRSVAGALKAEGGDEIKERAADRRTNARFPCRLAVSYHTLEHPFLSGEATSETLNISSKGLLFTSNDPLQPGQLVQVSVDWPARLENQVPLKLVAEGRIVRNNDGQTAMRIDKYEFRTRKGKGAPSTARDAEKKPSSRPAEAANISSSQPGTAAGIGTNGVKERRNF
jgi:DNA-binding NarL/FixJ family response regulator